MSDSWIDIAVYHKISDAKKWDENFVKKPFKIPANKGIKLAFSVDSANDGNVFCYWQVKEGQQQFLQKFLDDYVEGCAINTLQRVRNSKNMWLNIKQFQS